MKKNIILFLSLIYLNSCASLVTLINKTDKEETLIKKYTLEDRNKSYIEIVNYKNLKINGVKFINYQEDTDVPPIFRTQKIG